MKIVNIFFRKQQEVLTYTVGIFGALGLLSFLIYLFPSLTFSQPEQLCLAGVWQGCVPKEGQPSTTTKFSNCQWDSIRVPADVPAKMKKDWNGWIIYKRTFTAPPLCLTEERACKLVLGEVGDSVEAILNGKVIGRRGDFPPAALYSKHYPADFDLSRDLLNKGENANEIILKVYSMKKAQSGIRKSPVAILDAGAAHRAKLALVAISVIIPLVESIGLFVLAFLCLALIYYQKTNDIKFHSYSWFCFACALFMLSFSEVPREYVPIRVAGYLHYSLRTLFDLSFLLFICYFFEFSRVVRLCLCGPYFFLLSLFGTLFILDSFNIPCPLLGTSGFDTAFILMRIAAPLVLLPVCVGLYGSRKVKSHNLRRGLTFMFLILTCFQGSDILVFHGFYSLPYFVKFYPFLVALTFGFILLAQYQEERRSLVAAQKLAVQAAQVAHDIRSPLTALNLILGDLDRLSENHRILLRSAVKRIQDIANCLISSNRAHSNLLMVDKEVSTSVQDLSCVVESVVTEKRLQYRASLGIEIEFRSKDSAYGIFADIHTGELKRVISNIIDNSVEAINGAGKVSLHLYSVDKEIFLEVTDSGCGIPEAVISLLGKKGMSFNKPAGSGLGLFHAKQTLSQWQGKLTLKSEEGKGTQVIIQLPKASPPSWFVPALDLSSRTQVVILDDDESIHRVWQSRFNALSAKGKKIDVVHITNTSDFREFHRRHRNLKGLLHLVDFELKGSVSGLELIQDFDILDSSILVTSHYEEVEVQSRCSTLGLGLIPKEMAALVPIGA